MSIVTITPLLFSIGHIVSAAAIRLWSSDLTHSQIFHTFGEPELSKLDLVFVHGLTGNPYDTWLSPEKKEFWPNWLGEELVEVSIYTASYPASLLKKWRNYEMNVHERATNMLEHLATYGLGNRPLAFICHSLGGILVKEMLRISFETRDSSWKKISMNTKFVAFLATPHSGSALASIAKFFLPHGVSEFVNSLSGSSGALKSINQSYRNISHNAEIVTLAYYEKHPIPKGVVVVSADSADPGVGGCEPIGIDAHHESICKPSSRDQLVYRSLKTRLVAILNSIGPEDTATGVRPEATPAQKLQLHQVLSTESLDFDRFLCAYHEVFDDDDRTSTAELIDWLNGKGDVYQIQYYCFFCTYEDTVVSVAINMFSEKRCYSYIPFLGMTSNGEKWVLARPAIQAMLNATKRCYTEPTFIVLEMDHPNEVGISVKEKRRRMARVRSFEAYSRACGLNLRKVDIDYRQPSYHTDVTDKADRPMLLAILFAEETPSFLKKEEVVLIIEFLYKEVYLACFNGAEKEAKMYSKLIDTALETYMKELRPHISLISP